MFYVTWIWYIMAKCKTCAFYEDGYCAMQNYEVERGGRGCADWEEEEEDCGCTDEDLGYDQDEPWY